MEDPSEPQRYLRPETIDMTPALHAAIIEALKDGVLSVQSVTFEERPRRLEADLVVGTRAGSNIHVTGHLTIKGFEILTAARTLCKRSEKP